MSQPVQTQTGFPLVNRSGLAAAMVFIQFVTDGSAL